MKFVHLIGLTVYSKIIKNKERLTQMQTSKHLNKPYSALVNHIVDYYMKTLVIYSCLGITRRTIS